MERLRLGLEWVLNPHHVPFLLAQEKEWLGTAGLMLELVEPNEGVDALDEIRDGKLDAAITQPIRLLQDRASGDPVVGFARFLHSSGGVMYFEDQGIKRPRDMIGRRVQCAGTPTATGLAIVRTMVEADGGEYAAGDFTPVNHGWSHTDALIEGIADVAVLVFSNFELIEARGRGQRPAIFALKEWGVPDFCQLILITSDKLLAEKRPQLTHLVRALGRGVDAIYESPTEAKIIYQRHAGSLADDLVGQAIFDATLPCFTYDFTMSREYYLGLDTWMRQNGLITRDLDPAEFWTNELAL